MNVPQDGDLLGFQEDVPIQGGGAARSDEVQTLAWMVDAMDRRHQDTLSLMAAQQRTLGQMVSRLAVGSSAPAAGIRSQTLASIPTFGGHQEAARG